MKDPDNNLKKTIGFPVQISSGAEGMGPCGKAEGWTFVGLWEVDGQSRVEHGCAGHRGV